MKIFAVYARVSLKDKPVWIDHFRRKYDDPNEYHITLKQPCFINDEESEELKKRVAEYFRIVPHHKINVDFFEFFLESGSHDDGTIMIKAYPSEALIKLQNSLVNHLKEYRNYQDSKTIAYEEHFVPHITIGRNLTLEKYNEAVAELPSGVNVKGTLDEVVLSIVRNDSDEERIDSRNLTVYTL